MLGVAVCAARRAVAQQTPAFAVTMRIDEPVRASVAPIQFRDVKISPDQSAASQQLAARAPKSRAVPVFLIIEGVLLVGLIYDLVSRMARETYYGGVMVDCRPTPCLITSSPKVRPDMVVMVAPDGKMQAVQAGDFSTRMLTAFLSGAKKQ